jgi:hypothetical protein
LPFRKKKSKTHFIEAQNKNYSHMERVKTVRPKQGKRSGERFKTCKKIETVMQPVNGCT